MLPSSRNAADILSPASKTQKGQLQDEKQGSALQSSYTDNVNWRQFRPELHRKTHFKGAQSLYMQQEASLNLQDNLARDIVKEIFTLAGHKLPEQTLEEHYRLKQKESPNYHEQFISIDDLEEIREREKEEERRLKRKLAALRAADPNSAISPTGQLSISSSAKNHMIDQSLQKNANLVMIMDQRMRTGTRSPSKQQTSNCLHDQSLYSVDPAAVQLGTDQSVNSPDRIGSPISS